MKLKRILLVALIILMPLSFSSVAQATLILTLSDGLGHSASFSDTDGDGVLSATGVNVGQFALSSVGVTWDPATGTMNLSGLSWRNTNATTGGTLHVEFGDTAISGPYSTSTFSLAGTGTKPNQISGSGTAITNGAAYLSATFTESGTTWGTQVSGPVVNFSGLGGTMDIIFGSGGGSANPTASITVPEPGTLLLLGFGLAGLGIFSIRRRR